jgi:hypothetical protein
VGASIAKIQTDIRFLEDQRHDLLATRHPNKGGPDAKQAGAEAPPPHSSPPLTEGPINLSRPTEHQGIKTKERASLSPKPGSGPSTRPPEDIAEGPQVQGPRTSKGTNLTAKQARMVETSVWTGRDPAQTTHPPSHASSVFSDGEHEAQAVGGTRKERCASFQTSDQTRALPQAMTHKGIPVPTGTIPVTRNTTHHKHTAQWALV